MRNMNYFCIVKRFKTFIILTIICLISLNTNEISASNSVQSLTTDGDSIEISLLTCAPGQEVYSLYGHTAIRYNDKKKGIDIAINYGMFSFKAPFFILRFIFGLTDYEMGIIPFDAFCEEYRYENRSVTQQVLNLTAKEKKEIIKAIEKNYLPENRVYRYNYFYDNCTTRARNILLDNIDGEVCYPSKKESYPSFRDLIHSFNDNDPWARFGNDILLGAKADRKTNLNEYQFLPYNLMYDFEKATIKDKNGITRPLILSQHDVVKCQTSINNEKGFPLRPSTCAWIFLGCIIITTIIEICFKKNFWLFDALLIFIYGCIGLILLMMFFSKHPTTSTNLQIFLFNPLSLFYIYNIVKRNRTNRLWYYLSGSIACFFIGGLFQDYAEGTYILALSLLIRCIYNIIRKKNNDK